MGRGRAVWLEGFSEDAKGTDQLQKQGPDHVRLLAMGLLGEAGSVLSEVKKGRREGAAYPALRSKLLEEIGDFLWYYVRLVDVLSRGLLEELASDEKARTHRDRTNDLEAILGFGAAVGRLLGSIRGDGDARAVQGALRRVWDELNTVSAVAKIPLSEAAVANVRKRSDRWSPNPLQLPLFDEQYPK